MKTSIIEMKNPIMAAFTAAVLTLGSAPALADGSTSGAATGSGVVIESINISSALGAISLAGIDAFDGSLTSATGTFTVQANATDTVYNVWVTVPAGNLDAANDVYIAKAGAETLPLSVTLTGNTGANAVSLNPATINVEPTSASAGDGDAVSGTNADSGTTYTVTLTENVSLASAYPSSPDTTYSVTVTAHIAHGD